MLCKISSFSTIVFIIMMIFSSCQDSEKSVELYGVSFVCPKGWVVEEEESEADYINSFTIRKKGILFSGDVLVTVIEGMSAQEIFLNGHKQAVQESSTIKNLKFEGMKKSQYGIYSGLLVEYTAETMSIEHECKMYAFYENGRTIGIIENCVSEDRGTIYPAFKIIRESMRF